MQIAVHKFFPFLKIGMLSFHKQSNTELQLEGPEFFLLLILCMKLFSTVVGWLFQNSLWKMFHVLESSLVLNEVLEKKILPEFLHFIDKNTKYFKIINGS